MMNGQNFGQSIASSGLSAAPQSAYNTACMPQTIQPPVISALDNLDVEVIRLENEWMDLINRLSPVYRQELQKDASCESPMPPTSCDLEMRIQSPRHRIARLAEAMASIRNKLCI